MNCPQCGAAVSAGLQKCPACKCELSVIRELLALRDVVREVRNDSDRISSKMGDIESRLASLEPMIGAGTTEPDVAPVPDDDADIDVVEELPINTNEADAPMPPPVIPNVMPFSTTAKSTGGVLSRQSEIQFGQKWLLIVGIIITVLAVGYFLKYSFDRNWVGPAGRVALAYAAGLAAIGLGEWLRRRAFRVFGLYLIGGGIAVLYFAGYAAFQIYSLIDQPIAFGLMVLVTFSAGLMSVFYDTKWLAVLAIIGGFITPVVLSTGTDNQIALMTYMLILNGGILAIAAFKQWQLLNYLGLFCTWLLFSAWYIEHYEAAKFWITTTYLNAFFLTYALVPFAFYFVRNTTVSVTGFAITIPNAAIAFGISYEMIGRRFDTESVTFLALAYAAVYFAMAAFLRLKRRQSKDAFVMLFAMGMLFLLISVPLHFSKHWITVFWCAEGLVLLWAALRLDDSRLRGGALIILLVATAKLLLHDYVHHFKLDVSEMVLTGGYFVLASERWITVAAVTAALCAAARLLKVAGLTSNDWRTNLAGFFYGAFAVMLFIALNVEVAGYFHEAAARARFASISVLWAVYASVLMVLGFAKNFAILRRVAIALFGATVIKVFLRDMADVDTPFRILSFLVLGLLLVSVSYLYHRYAARILQTVNDDVGNS